MYVVDFEVGPWLSLNMASVLGTGLLPKARVSGNQDVMEYMLNEPDHSFRATSTGSRVDSSILARLRRS